jgi:hypothetical protein
MWWWCAAACVPTSTGAWGASLYLLGTSPYNRGNIYIRKYQYTLFPGDYHGGHACTHAGASSPPFYLWACLHAHALLAHVATCMPRAPCACSTRLIGLYGHACVLDRFCGLSGDAHPDNSTSQPVMALLTKGWVEGVALRFYLIFNF